MKKRVVIIALVIFSLYSLLIAQYFKIQILETKKWKKEALGQHEFVVKEPFKRGTFYSNTSLKQGHPESPQALAVDVTKFHLYIDPLAIPEKSRKAIVTQLNQTIGTGLELEREFEYKTRSRRIANWLEREEKEKVLSWWLPFAKREKIARNALYFLTDYRRCYPFGKLLGQVLHTIREMKDEQTAEGLPTGGLEAYFNDYLKGKQGRRKLLRSPLNQLDIDKVIEEPEDGADIYLTINHCIQAIAEEELEKGVKATRAKGGWAVMMDPSNGEILAFAQYPFFDPTYYREFFNDPFKIEDSKVKALTDAFELGSIMKPITIAIGLKGNSDCELAGKELIFNPNDKVDGMRTIYPGRANRPLKEVTRLHRALNMEMAIQKSSNIYMAQIIEKVIARFGNEWYRRQLIDLFGFGQKTGIELPAESAGLVPTPGKCHPNGALEWSVPTPYSLAMGYNILATSLQMLRAYAVFANGGYLVHPTLVRKILAGDQVLYSRETHCKKAQKVFDKEIIDQVVKAMKFTTKKGGSASTADIFGYSEAGKTGTAEKIIGGVYCKKTHISSFVGFAPARVDIDLPARFVLIVSIDEPEAMILESGYKNQLGGRCAAPVFKEIARRTFEYLGIPPDDPFGYPLGDPRYHPEKADWMPEVQALKLLYDQWNN